jgi:hypothetical protein
MTGKSEALPVASTAKRMSRVAAPLKPNGRYGMISARLTIK